MAYSSAHCDNSCRGCSQNRSNWCIWKDRPAMNLTTTASNIEYDSTGNSTHYWRHQVTSSGNTRE